jgi:predicted enzyme related to lactoylglutathione lyase
MKPTCGVTVIPVSDLERSLAFYRDVLGFTVSFSYQGFYAGIEMGPVQLHLSAKPRSAPGTGSVYIFADEVDEYYAAVRVKGANAPEPPKNFPYGMRDFAVFDPDNNQIGFGAPHDEK